MTTTHIAPPPAEAATDLGIDLAAELQREPDTAMEALGMLLVYAAVTGTLVLGLLLAIYG